MNKYASEQYVCRKMKTEDVNILPGEYDGCKEELTLLLLQKNIFSDMILKNNFIEAFLVYVRKRRSIEIVDYYGEKELLIKLVSRIRIIVDNEPFLKYFSVTLQNSEDQVEWLVSDCMMTINDFYTNEYLQKDIYKLIYEKGWSLIHSLRKTKEGLDE